MCWVDGVEGYYNTVLYQTPMTRWVNGTGGVRWRDEEEGDVTKKKNHTEAGGNVRKVCLFWVRGRRGDRRERFQFFFSFF
jgi:hypothetical protein